MGSHASVGMAVILWKRTIEVRVADLALRDLRIAVRLRRKTGEAANGTIQIWNLTPDHHARIRHRSRIIVRAGHSGQIGQLLDGVVQEAKHERRRTDVLSTIRVGALHTQERPKGWTSNASYPGTQPVLLIAEELLADFNPVDGVGLVINDPSPLRGLTVRDFTATTSTASALDKLLDAAGGHLTWSENDGVVEFQRSGPSTTTQSAPIRLSRETGLLANPIPTDDGVQAVAFLQARARIGGLVSIDSDHHAGSYRIVGIAHSGDNWRGRFETRFDLRAA